MSAAGCASTVRVIRTHRGPPRPVPVVAGAPNGSIRVAVEGSSCEQNTTRILADRVEESAQAVECPEGLERGLTGAIVRVVAPWGRSFEGTLDAVGSTQV